MIALNPNEGRSRPRRTRGQKRAANRRRLLDAAREAFSERGYHGASIESIVERSGLSNGALYYNFAGKQELFLALFDERIDARVAALERAFPASSEGTAERAERVRRSARDALRELDDPKEWAMFFEFVAHAVRTPAFRRRFGARMRRMRAAFARAAEQQGVEAAPAAAGIMALSHGLAIQRATDPRAVPDELLGDLVVALLRGLATGQSSASTRRPAS